MDRDITAVFPSFNMPPTERGKERWRKVVNTAKRLFEERGYNEVSLAEIVRESGGSFATVYRWFGNKDDLFLCVVLDHISKVHEVIERASFSGATAEEDVETLVGKLIANIPFGLVRHVFSETNLFKGGQAQALELVEKNTNVPIADLFARIRKAHGVEYAFSDEEMALVFVRFIRGLFLELTLDASQTPRRLEQGKRLIVSVLTSFIRSPQGARR